MTIQPDHIAHLIERLDSDPETRAQVKAELLALDADIVEPLIQALRSEEGRRAYAAADILGELSDERAVQPLIATLTTKNTLLGSGVVQALRKYDGLDLIPPLVEALPHANLMTQQSIIIMLQAYGDSRAVDMLVSQLHTTASSVLRVAIIKTLIQIGSVTILGDITRYADDPDHHVRKWVQEAQTHFGKNQ